MIPAHLLQQLRNIPVHEIIRALKEMASPIVGREGLEESIDTQMEAVPLFTTIMPVIRFLLEHSAMY